jgi:hypothetical protein
MDDEANQAEPDQESGPPTAEPDPTAGPAGRPDPGSEGATAGSGEPPESETPRPAFDLGGRPSSRRILRPWQAIEFLDRQWVDAPPFGKPARSIVSLVLTVDEDPRSFDYLGALTGASAREVASACALWLEAQLAADALSIRRVLRPMVELIPAAHLWFVVRSTGSHVLFIDGPGYPSPLTAVRAARVRYLASLQRQLETERAPESLEDDGEAEPDDDAADEDDAEPAGDAGDEPGDEIP